METSVAEAFAIDYENWMSNLPLPLTLSPIQYLAIPGSHDSFSYTISPKSDISPDDSQILFFNKIPIVRIIAKTIVYRWSLTQGVTCTTQLEAGVRYFDLRVAVEVNTECQRLIHGLYGIDVAGALEEIQQFLKKHPKEIVFLDFQHLYNFTEEDHKTLINLIVEKFGQSLCPVTPDLSIVTLAWLWERRYQVFAFYRSSSLKMHNCIWPGSFIPNPWPNTTDPQRMVEFLQDNYENGRPRNKFYVTQGVLTPNTKYVCCHMFTTLMNKLVNLANSALFQWLADKKMGPNGINIVISDFVCHGSPDIVKFVIELNYKNDILMNKIDLIKEIGEELLSQQIEQ